MDGEAVVDSNGVVLGTIYEWHTWRDSLRLFWTVAPASARPLAERFDTHEAALAKLVG